MIKKIFLILTIMVATLPVAAQLPVGAWTVHSPFNSVDKIVETKNKMFFLSSGSLFSVDKQTEETRTLNLANDLNGGQVKTMFANPNGKYIIVVYSDNNLDRINDDGTVVNISDIADALLPGSPVINHVGFSDDRFYVAASFGLVTFNAKNNQAVETMFTPMPVNRVTGIADRVVIHYNFKWLAAKASDHLISIDKFSDFNNHTWQFTAGGSDIYPLSDTRLVFPVASGNNLRITVADFDWDKYEMNTNDFTVNGQPVNLSQFTTVGRDKMFAVSGGKMYLFDPDCQPRAPQVSTLPSVLSGQTLSAYDGLDNLWAGNAQGMSKYDISNPASPVQLTDKFGKTPFATVQCNFILPQRNGSLVFFNRCSSGNAVLGYTSNANLSLSRHTEDGFANISPEALAAPGQTATVISRQMAFLDDPLDPEAYFVATNDKGLFRIKNGVTTHTLNINNSPMSRQGSFYFNPMLILDENNYIWMGQEVSGNNMMGVPASAFQSGSEIPMSEYISVTAPGKLGRSGVSLYLNKSKLGVFGGGNYSKLLNFLPLKNSAGVTGDSFILVSSYIDQDNKTLSFNHIIALCEDNDGRLWVGTDQGVFEITDPSKVTAGSTKVNHLKVPRNDGTGLADYLLDAVPVQSIAVDYSNRKWLATKTDGVYLVSPDGDEILEHFTSSNSMLPSDNVYSVACDPNSSSIFFATSNGVVEYNSTSAPASETLDNVYAFPNPVRPEYSGWITVTGLMDNTLVKIADSAGNVFFQGRSEGGMITWDGCNASGDRVKTGVYYVFASVGTSGDTISDSCVTKIMVIN